MSNTKSPAIHKIRIQKPVTSLHDLPELQACDILEISFEPDVFMNSTGIRDWIKWIHAFAINNSQAQIRLFECPTAVIQIVNMVNDFLPGNSDILSFYVPYYSEDIDETKFILLKKEINYPKDKIIFPTVKDSQGHTMELDVNEKLFFRFLTPYLQSHKP